MPTASQIITPNDTDIHLALQSGKFLAPLLTRNGNAHLHIRTQDNLDKEVFLPEPAIRALMDVLRELGQGNSVTVTPINKELTTQQAADFLMVSRPFLIEELLEGGKIPFRLVGNRRRVRMTDLVQYRQEEEREIARREAVMRELVAETESLGLYR